MITIMIANDEKKVKEILTRLLRMEGYSVSQDRQDNEDVIKLDIKNSAKNTVSIEDKVIELEESLYGEKRGVLYKAILEKVEKPLIEHLLERTEGNQLMAARILGLNRNTLRAKIKKLAINVDRWKI